VKYTTLEKITRRLKGRVADPASASLFDSSTYSEDLVIQIVDQVEARIDQTLKSLYTFPLDSSNDSILGEITELGCICQLLPTYQILETTNPSDNFQVFSCKRFDKYLEELASGSLKLNGDTLSPTMKKDFTKVSQRVSRNNIVW
jgi:hypothetical protein